MKKLLLILLCVPLMFSCGESDNETENTEKNDTDNLQREITSEMRKNGYSGKGTWNFNGDKYVGEYKDGKYHGQGTYTSANGNKYVGEFKDGKKSGQGTYISATNPGYKYVGEYKDGKYHGQGTLISNLGVKYVGELKQMFPDGKGTMTYPNGVIEEGLWKDGKTTKKIH